MRMVAFSEGRVHLKMGCIGKGLGGLFSTLAVPHDSVSPSCSVKKAIIMFSIGVCF